MNPDPSFEAGPVAFFATRRSRQVEAGTVCIPALIETHRPVIRSQILELLRCRMVAFGAVRAQAPDQPLTQHPEKGIGDVQWVHTHVEQPREGLGGIVRMQGGEHQMAGQGRLQRNRSGLLVAHLADHDDVRIKPQEAAHDSRKIKTDLRPHLHLAQSPLSDLNRIFGRPDFYARQIDIPQDGMQGRGLAGAGRAHAQDHPVGPRDQFSEHL